LLVELIESQLKLSAISRISCGFDTTEDKSARKQQRLFVVAQGALLGRYLVSGAEFSFSFGRADLIFDRFALPAARHENNVAQVVNLRTQLNKLRYSKLFTQPPSTCKVTPVM
jgi:hypothetical protein